MGLRKYTKAPLFIVFFTIFAYKYDFLSRLLRDYPILAIRRFSHLKEVDHFEINNPLGSFFILILNLFKGEGQSYLSMHPQSCSTSRIVPVYGQIIAIKTCSLITFKAYRLIYSILKETHDLLNNRTYNPLMKRYDAIYLKPEQMLVSMLLFAIMFIILRSLVFFYFLFLFLAISIKFCEFLFLSALDSGHCQVFFSGIADSKYEVLKCIVSGKVSKLVDYNNSFGL